MGFLESDPVSDPSLMMLEGMENVRSRMEVVNEVVRKEGAAGKRLHTTCVRVKRRVEEREWGRYLHLARLMYLCQQTTSLIEGGWRRSIHMKTHGHRLVLDTSWTLKSASG